MQKWAWRNLRSFRQICFIILGLSFSPLEFGRLSYYQLQMTLQRILAPRIVSAKLNRRYANLTSWFNQPHLTINDSQKRIFTNQVYVIALSINDWWGAKYRVVRLYRNFSDIIWQFCQNPNLNLQPAMNLMRIKNPEIQRNDFSSKNFSSF